MKEIKFTLFKILYFYFLQIEFVAQQLGFKRQKRGYKPLKVENLVKITPQKDPTDPYFKYQWYLVSIILRMSPYLAFYVLSWNSEHNVLSILSKWRKMTQFKVIATKQNKSWVIHNKIFNSIFRAHEFKAKLLQL